MVRTQIILDEPTHERIRSLAFKKHQSMSELVRKILHQSLGMKTEPVRFAKRFSFVGAAASKRRENVSEMHDDILGQGRW